MATRNDFASESEFLLSCIQKTNVAIVELLIVTALLLGLILWRVW